jgi:hypothetical protein
VSGVGATPKAQPTTWYRKTFTLPPGPLPSALLLRLRRDDGCVVWLNGQEVQRLDLPLGAVTAATPAAFVMTGDGDVVTTLLDPALLQPGVNMLAIESHRPVTLAPELLIDAELTAF